MPFWLLLSFHHKSASVPVAAAYLFLVRRMARSTRIGLWLLPWLPLGILVGKVWSLYDSAIFITHFQGPLPLRIVAFMISGQLAFAAFVAGLLLLIVAGIRHLVRLRCFRLTSR
jgi:hypothetical protein